MRNLSGLYIKQLLYYGVFLFSAIHLGYGQYTIKNVPNPKSQGQDYFVSNPDGILSFYAKDSINALAVDIERQTTAEVAVVVITDFQGEDDFEFAFDLFNEWGVGKAQNDNGLLLLVARDKRAYRFITGYGMEATLPDALLKRIGEFYLVPHFRQGQYDEGILKAMETIREILLSPENADEIMAGLKKPSFWDRNKMVLLDSLLIILLTLVLLKWMDHIVKKTVKDKRSLKKAVLFDLGSGCVVLFVIAIIVIIVLAVTKQPEIIFRMSLMPWYLVALGSILVLIKYSRGSELVSKSFRDEKNRLEALEKYHCNMLVPLLASPLALFIVGRFRKRQKRMSQRFIPPDDSGDWERLDRDKLKKKTELLDKGQLREERELSRSYEIWKHKVSGEIKAIGWEGIKVRDFSDCPSCSYRTFKQPFTKTIKAATYKASGKGERIQECVHCGHRVSLGEVAIPRKRRSSSSSSSGGGGYSGGSSSGSFGGGSSGGGGAGGRW